MTSATPGVRFLEWARRLCLGTLVLLSLIDREWGFVIVLVIAEGLGRVVMEVRVQDAEDETVRRVKRVGL